MNDDELKAAAKRRAQAINARWQYPGNPYANSSLGDEEIRRDASRLADAMCDRIAADESPALVAARKRACHEIGDLFCWCVENLGKMPPRDGDWLGEVKRRLAADEAERSERKFTDEQCFSLNSSQHDSMGHPYTCGNDSRHRPLIATPRGWRCSDCDYTQDWALGIQVKP
jgi:hypothetical protein